MKFSLSVLAAVFLFGVAAAAAVVDVTTLDETSDGPGRHHRRTLLSKKNPAAAAAVAVAPTVAAAPTLGVVGGDACYDIGGGNETACKGRGGCYWYPHWGSPHGWCSSLSGVDCGGHRAKDCTTCPYYDSVNNQGKKYCKGECVWIEEGFRATGLCEPKRNECYGDGVLCISGGPLPTCDNCCDGYHLGPIGVEAYCGPNINCWGKDTYCLPGISCTKCCNSWSWYFTTGSHCD